MKSVTAVYSRNRAFWRGYPN